MSGSANANHSISASISEGRSYRTRQAQVAQCQLMRQNFALLFHSYRSSRNGLDNCQKIGACFCLYPIRAHFMHKERTCFVTMEATTTTANTLPPAKKRKTKELPQALSRLTESNFRSILKFRLETDTSEKGEVMVAYEAVFDEEGDIVETYDLNKLTLDHLRILCKKVGVQYVNKCSKFQCRKALWVLANYQNQRIRDGASFSTSADRTSTNIIRITNVLFHHNFFDSFLALNDIKNRLEHETGGLPKNFWCDVADAYNGASEDDDSALQVIIPEEDPHYNEISLMNLEEFDIMTSNCIRKKFNALMKVRKVMKKNMTQSGEHDNDAYNFVDNAIKTVGISGLSNIGCYYFYQRCGMHPEVDASFADTMDDYLKGNTDSPLSSLGSVASTNNAGTEKKRAYAAIAEMSTAAVALVGEMKETNRLAHESTKVAQETANEMKKKNQLAQQSQLIALAQHLGKRDILEQLLATLSGASANHSLSGEPNASP